MTILLGRGPASTTTVADSTTTAGQGAVEVRRLGPGEGLILRSARLAALDDSPKSFIADREDEAGLPPTDWEAQLSQSTWVAAYRGGIVRGIARMIEDEEDPLSRYVERVWVDSLCRRQGILRRMTEVLERQARESGVVRLRLWVLDHNHEARAAYEQLGFSHDDGVAADRQPLETALGRFELRMDKLLHAR